MAKKTYKRAAILSRVSTQQQETHLNLERQISTLRTKATKDGYIVTDQLIFQEQYTGDDRELDTRGSLVELMKAVENNLVDVIYVKEYERISRDPFNKTARVRWFLDHKIPMYIYDEELWTLFPHNLEENPKAIEYLFGHATQGKRELLKLKKRTMDGRNELAKGGWYVGHLSDGYTTLSVGPKKRIVIDEERKDVIVHIFSLYVDGKSTDEIANILNEEEIPTTNKYRFLSPLFSYSQHYKRKGIEYDRNELKWQGVQISQILANEWYKGKRTYNNNEYDVPAIISPELWEEVKIMREQRAIQFRSNRTSKKHNYLLANYFFCGNCGRKMYGHYTGKNNHYYCSSVDQGNNCGLRGINKENVETIVSEIIRHRALNEFVEGDNTELTNYFKLGEEQKKNINKEISEHKKQIEKKKTELIDLEKKHGKLLEMLIEAKVKENERNEWHFNKLIEDNENTIKKKENEIISLEREIISLKKQLRIGENIRKIFENIGSLEDIKTFRKLIEKAVEKIEIFNIDNSISYIKIKYLNGKEDGALYSFPLLKNKFLYLKSDYIGTDPEDDSPKMFFDFESAKVIIKEGYNIVFQYIGDSFIVISNNDLENEFYSTLKSRCYSKSITIKKFLQEARNGFPTLWEIDNRLFLEEDERRAEQESKYKEWRKKYNTGLPTSLPFVVHDENYEEYESKRKHLYNRKYKIKKNKKLTPAQKKEELDKIDYQLSLLRAKVKYLSREESVARYNQNKENSKS